MRFLIFIIWFVRKVGGNIFVIFVGNLLCGGNGRGLGNRSEEQEFLVKFSWCGWEWFWRVWG